MNVTRGESRMQLLERPAPEESQKLEVLNDGFTQNSFFHMLRGYGGGENSNKPVNIDEMNNSNLFYQGLQSLGPAYLN